MITKNLTVIGYSNGWTLWHYKSEDDKKTIEADGYFAKVKNILAPGDMMIVLFVNGKKRSSAFYQLDEKLNIGRMK
ncbi:MAG: hypothetical protein FWD15_04395 [Alphaproteobacteria bacterium]|nr:hypothetical protein [Alphaproteobacteria bacterium]